MRKSETKVDELFLDRWSPRSFKADPISESDLWTLLEAARWAPSCFNEQPWLFYVGNQPASKNKILSCLVEDNQIWAKNAPVLMILFAKKNFDRTGKPNNWAAFDCGSAWMSLALQAKKLGLVTHAMAGFEVEKTYQTLNVDPQKFQAICAIAVGYQGASHLLPPELKERETPNDRKKLKDVAVFVE